MQIQYLNVYLHSCLGRLAQGIQSIPISSEVVGTRRLKKILGRLAQGVQSIPIPSEVVGAGRLKNKYWGD